jgi:tetratricopeptide (TPR) repeat protein
LSAALLKVEVHLALGERVIALRLIENVAAQAPDRPELKSLLGRIQAPRDNSGDRKVQSASYRQPSIYSRLKRGDDDGDSPPGFPAAAASAVASAKSPVATRPQSSLEETLRCGENALAADKPTAARSYFQRAIAAAPDDESVAVNAAVASLRHDQPELAAELAQSSLSRWPKSAALYRTLGMAEYRLEHGQSAQAALGQALSLDNRHALTYFLLGCTLSKLGQNEEAERNFTQARQLDTRYALKP